MTAPRVFFYVQHLLGIGHLTRVSRVAEALAQDGFDVTMVTGGTPVDGFPAPHIRHVQLPVLASGDENFSGLVDGEGKPITDAYRNHRRDCLLAAYDEARPDIVVTEAFPFGRRQVRFELLPLIERIEATTPRPLLATSVRDILQARTKPGRDEETVSLVKAHYDAVLVHGDPAFAPLEESFPLATEIADRVRYTGIVAPAYLQPSADRFDIVVSAGGGAVGQALIEASLDAAALLDPGLSWLVTTGPNLPASAFEAITKRAPAQVTVTRFRRDFGGLLANARLSVSQAGYNTVGDILLAGCRSVLVPFAAGGETEQKARAERLAAVGRAVVVDEAELDGRRLAGAVAQALAPPDPQDIQLKRDGAQGTARILKAMLAARASGTA
jgi:predicted glycosyltransferase